MRFCKSLFNLLLAIILISVGIGIIIGKLCGFIIYLMAFIAIGIGIYIIFAL